MKKECVVSTLSAKPGQKVTGVVEFKVDGKPFSLPMYIINGEKEGPTLVIFGGIHAAEYASIAAALEIGQTLKPETVKGCVIVVPVVNQAGFPIRSIYINPMDGVNLNRVFPGKANGSASEQIAAWLTQNVIKKADYFIDLHGGDLIEALVPFALFPETGQPSVDKTSLEMAQVFGIKYLVRKQATSGSTFSAVAGGGTPAILVESGGQGIWPRKAVLCLVRGVQRVMRQYGMLSGGKPAKVETVVLQEFIWLYSEHTGFWYPGTEVGKDVQKGQVLGQIKDVWGNTLQTVNASATGRVLFLVSSLAINKGDPLLAIGA